MGEDNGNGKRGFPLVVKTWKWEKEVSSSTSTPEMGFLVDREGEQGFWSARRGAAAFWLT